MVDTGDELPKPPRMRLFVQVYHLIPIDILEGLSQPVFEEHLPEVFALCKVRQINITLNLAAESASLDRSIR